MKLLTVKGHTGEIEFVFGENTDVNTLTEEIEKIDKHFFKDAAVQISYRGAKLSYNEEMQLERVIKKSLGENCALKKKHKLSKAQIMYSLCEDEKICRVIERTLRSGECVKFEGDVIVYGDVNPGASIIAKGNVTVIGALRGSVQIKKEGRVYAAVMQPAQIRIGKSFSYNKFGKSVGQAIALKENDEIILQSL